MKNLVCSTALVVAVSLVLDGVGFAHGGSYPGPKPAEGAGGAPTEGGPSAPSTGGPATPVDPGTEPTTPGPTGPPTPPSGGGGRPAGGGPPTGGGTTPSGGGPRTPGGGARAPSTPGGAPSTTPGPGTPGGTTDLGADFTRWQFWWELNKERYLDVKRRVWAQTPTTGSDGFFVEPEGQTVARDQLRPSLEMIRNVVVPGLLDALKKDASNDVVTGVLIALAKIGDERDEHGRSLFTDRMTPFLRDANQEVAETAALALGILGDETNFELLNPLMRNDRAMLRGFGVELASDVSERSRAFAAYGLGLLGSRSSELVRAWIVDDLIDFLDHEGRTMRRRDVPVACVIALGLTPLRADIAPPPRGRPVEASKGARTNPIKTREEQVLWLNGWFLDSKLDPWVRAHAPRAMAKLCADLPQAHALRTTIANTLLDALAEHSKENSVVQQSCALALGELGDCDADGLDAKIRATLMRCHGTSAEQQIKRFALIALAQGGGRPGASPADPLAALNAKKDNPRAFLLERLAKAPSGERCWAALALGVQERGLAEALQPSSNEVRVALRTMLRDAAVSDEIGAYAIALGILRDTGAKEILRMKFDRVADPDPRGYVAIALGMIDDVESIGAIQRVVAKSKYQHELLRSAAIALGLLGDRHVVDDLITMLSTASGLSSQSAIASALGAIGDARSIDPLVRMLADPQKTPLARAFAAAALGIVADKDPHPWVSRISLDINYRANTETLMSGNGGMGVLEIL